MIAGNHPFSEIKRLKGCNRLGANAMQGEKQNEKIIREIAEQMNKRYVFDDYLIDIYRIFTRTHFIDNTIVGITCEEKPKPLDSLGWYVHICTPEMDEKLEFVPYKNLENDSDARRLHAEKDKGWQYKLSEYENRYEKIQNNEKTILGRRWYDLVKDVDW